MAVDRRRQIESLCLQALEKPDAAGRRAFVNEACGDDAALRREVMAMLAVEPEAEAFLEAPRWAAPVSPLAPGTRLGPYEIHSLIGEGGMGVVYKAPDTRLDRTVAIKVLPADVGEGAEPGAAPGPADAGASPRAERRARFEREAKTIAALNHPHICALYDVGMHDPSTGSGQAALYLVMEYLSGFTLAERLARGPLPLEQALTVASEIAAALAAAHRQGIVHRDLKPGNVMLANHPFRRPALHTGQPLRRAQPARPSLPAPRGAHAAVHREEANLLDWE